MPPVSVAVTKSYPALVEALAKEQGRKGTRSGASPPTEWELGSIRAFLAGEPPTGMGIIRPPPVVGETSYPEGLTKIVPI